MTEQRSPWARPPAGSEEPAGARPYPAKEPAMVAAGAGRAEAGPIRPRPGRAAGEPPRAAYGAGTVTRLAPPAPPVPPAVAPPAEGGEDPGRRNRTMMRWFGGGAFAVVAVGVVVLLAMVM